MPPIFYFKYNMFKHDGEGDFIAHIESEGMIEKGDMLNFNGTLLKVIIADTEQGYISVKCVGSSATIRQVRS